MPQSIDKLSTIVLTMGDPAGVGPEIVLKALADPEVAPLAHWNRVGDPRIFEMAERLTGLRLAPAQLTAVGALGDIGNFSFGRLDARCGQAAVEYVRIATGMVPAGRGGRHGHTALNKRAVTLSGAGSPGIPNTSRNSAEPPSRACCWPASGSRRFT